MMWSGSCTRQFSLPEKREITNYTNGTNHSSKEPRSKLRGIERQNLQA